jgi:lycopene cyclase domain-containing protein
VIICFVFSFHPKIKFNRHFPAFFKASMLVAVPFIIWDFYFTGAGVWSFNEDYTVGWNIMKLPMEEWLFFICIPFASIFTYYCIEKFFDLRWTNAFNNIIVFVNCVFMVLIALVHHDRMYTFFTALVVAAVLVYLHFIAGSEWIGQATFTYIILLPGFFLVNGILTGMGLESPIVNYNASHFLGLRMITIPVEDCFYGYSLFLMNVYLFNRSRHAVVYESPVK